MSESWASAPGLPVKTSRATSKEKIEWRDIACSKIIELTLIPVLITVLWWRNVWPPAEGKAETDVMAWVLGRSNIIVRSGGETGNELWWPLDYQLEALVARLRS